MANEMELFEAEVGKIGSVAEERRIDKTPSTAMKRNCQENVEEMGEKEPKLSLVEQAKRQWKQRKLDEEVALAAAGKGAWTEHKDPNSGVTYYYNNITKASSWTRPEDFVEPTVASIEATIVAKNPKWSVSQDPSSGQFYYFNKENGQSTWDRPGDFAEAEYQPAVAASTVLSNASKGDVDQTPPEFADADTVIDLVASTKYSDFVASDKIYARVIADSEDGISLVGFTLRLNTPFAKMMEAWCDYQELPVGSVYFELGDEILVPMDTPGQRGFSPEHGMLKIEAKPCEECTDEEAEEAEKEKQDEIADWQKRQKKQRKRAMKAAAAH